MNSDTLINEKISFAKDDPYPEMMSAKYPWSSLAQFALLKQFKKNNSPRFKEQATKTALFFNDSNWLAWQLHMLSTENEVRKMENEEPSATNVEEEAHIEKIQQSLSHISLQANTAEERISFEPLHTVDYFLSQGIKISDAPITNDKLGNQMKSFTEWLKGMKKIHTEKLAEGDEQTDKNIQQIAEHSNADAEVVTEAMANVCIKQNKTEKAIEIFEKLSLLNPSKSAYFAAKIDSLKTT